MQSRFQPQSFPADIHAQHRIIRPFAGRGSQLDSLSFGIRFPSRCPACNPISIGFSTRRRSGKAYMVIDQEDFASGT